MALAFPRPVQHVNKSDPGSGLGVTRAACRARWGCWGVHSAGAGRQYDKAQPTPGSPGAFQQGPSRIESLADRPDRIEYCDRGVFEKLKGLDRDTLEAELKDLLRGTESEALLRRRNRIVDYLREENRGTRQEGSAFPVRRASNAPSAFARRMAGG